MSWIHLHWNPTLSLILLWEDCLLSTRGFFTICIWIGDLHFWVLIFPLTRNLANWAEWLGISSVDESLYFPLILPVDWLSVGMNWLSTLLIKVAFTFPFDTVSSEEGLGSSLNTKASISMGTTWQGISALSDFTVYNCTLLNWGSQSLETAYPITYELKSLKYW